MGRKKGKLIVFEGTDGSGKATQAKLLAKSFKKKKIPTELISFPDYKSAWGKIIKKYLAGDFGDVGEVSPYLAAILYAGDRLAASEKIKRWLVVGKIVVCDRYTASNIAHQAAKIENKSGRERFIKWLEGFEYGQNKIPRENLVIYLSVPISSSQKLMSSRKKDIHERNRSYLSGVSKVFDYLASKRSYWKKIDCADNKKLLTREEIHQKVLDFA